jgi:hypothetical protein
VDLTMAASWFGRHALDAGQCGRWQVGPFTLWARRTAREWQLASSASGDTASADVRVEVPCSATEPAAEAEVHRYAFRAAPAVIALTPALADRPVVVRPREPLLLPPDEEVTVYASVPLWVEVGLGEPRSVVLDRPLLRPSDTWFGPSRRHGELCYSSRTSAHLERGGLTPVPHQAVAAVRVVNRGRTLLPVERLRLPIEQMSVYRCQRDTLWTESITLERQGEDAMAGVKLGSGPPAEAGAAALVRGPRTPTSRGLSIRAFSERLTRELRP